MNPVLRGWANNFHTVVRSEMLKALDRYVFLKVWNWCKRKTRGGKLNSKKKIKTKYFKSQGGWNWTFFGQTQSGKEILLFNLKEVKIRRHTLVQDLNPYLRENQDYFQKRENKSRLLNPTWTWKQKKLLKRVSSICKVCEQPILENKEVEVHHILPVSKGGDNSLKNQIILHKQCHAQVTHTKDPNMRALFVLKGVLKIE